MSNKPKAIEIISVTRTRKTIRIHWNQGDGTFDLDERDNPLPSFGNAFDALAELVPSILHVPAAWSENLRVVGLKIGNQGGASTVIFICRKSLSDASKEFSFPTPYRLLANPSEPGSYTPPLVEKDAAIVWEAVEEAKKYVRGERSQGQIVFEADGDDDPEGDDANSGQTELPEVPRKEKKKDRKRASKKAR